MAKYTLKRKTFAFNEGTWKGIQDAFNNNSTPDAQKMYEAYKRKYAKEIAEFNSKPAAQASATAAKNAATNTPAPKKQTEGLFKRGMNKIKGTWKSGKLGKGKVLAGAGLAVGAPIGAAFYYNRRKQQY